jgi:hypothetical protein
VRKAARKHELALRKVAPPELGILGITWHLRGNKHIPKTPTAKLAANEAPLQSDPRSANQESTALSMTRKRSIAIRVPRIGSDVGRNSPVDSDSPAIAAFCNGVRKGSETLRKVKKTP